MSNMSYCRFRNTLEDLHDCYEHWSDDDNDSSAINEEEVKARARLLVLCQNIVADYGDDE